MGFMKGEIERKQRVAYNDIVGFTQVGHTADKRLQVCRYVVSRTAPRGSEEKRAGLRWHMVPTEKVQATAKAEHGL